MKNEMILFKSVCSKCYRFRVCNAVARANFEAFLNTEFSDDLYVDYENVYDIVG